MHVFLAATMADYVDLEVDVTIIQGAELDGHGPEDLVVVSVAGELDLTSADRLRHALRMALESHSGAVVVDVGEISFIDAAGIGVLIGGATKARETGARFALRHPSRAVTRVLSLLGPEAAALPVEGDSE